MAPPTEDGSERGRRPAKRKNRRRNPVPIDDLYDVTTEEESESDIEVETPPSKKARQRDPTPTQRAEPRAARPISDDGVYDNTPPLDDAPDPALATETNPAEPQAALANQGAAAEQLAPPRPWNAINRPSFNEVNADRGWKPRSSMGDEGKEFWNEAEPEKNESPTPRKGFKAKPALKGKERIRAFVALSDDEGDAPPSKKSRPNKPAPKRKAKDAGDSSRLAKKTRSAAAVQDHEDDGDDEDSSSDEDGKRLSGNNKDHSSSDNDSSGSSSEDDKDPTSKPALAKYGRTNNPHEKGIAQSSSENERSSSSSNDGNDPSDNKPGAARHSGEKMSSGDHERHDSGYDLSSSSSSEEEENAHSNKPEPKKPEVKFCPTQVDKSAGSAQSGPKASEPKRNDTTESSTSSLDEEEVSRKWKGWSVGVIKKTAEDEFAEMQKKAAEEVAEEAQRPSTAPNRRSNRVKSTRAATQPPSDVQPTKKPVNTTAKKPVANRVTKTEKAAPALKPAPKTKTGTRAGTEPPTRQTKASRATNKRPGTAQTQATRAPRSRAGSEAPSARPAPSRSSRAPSVADTTRVTRSRAGSVAQSDLEDEPKKVMVKARRPPSRPRSIVPPGAEDESRRTGAGSQARSTRATSEAGRVQENLQSIARAAAGLEESFHMTQIEEEPESEGLLPPVEAPNENVVETHGQTVSNSSPLSPEPSEWHDAEEESHPQDDYAEEEQAPARAENAAPYTQMEDNETQVALDEPLAVDEGREPAKSSTVHGVPQSDEAFDMTPIPPRHRTGRFIMGPRRSLPGSLLRRTPRDSLSGAPLPLPDDSATQPAQLREPQQPTRPSSWIEPPVQSGEPAGRETDAAPRFHKANTHAPEVLSDNLERSQKGLDQLPSQTAETTSKTKAVNTRPKEAFTLLVCGNNRGGQLGLGSSVPEEKKPVILDALGKMNVVDFDCGAHHCIALTAGGDVMTWGSGTEKDGALGTKYVNEDGEEVKDPTIISLDEEMKATPAYVDLRHLSGAAIVQVVATNDASFALTEQGMVLGWGTFMRPDANGAWETAGLGRNAVVEDRPIVLRDCHDIVRLAGGGQHILAIDAAGKLFSMGDNNHGQLGLTRDLYETHFYQKNIHKRSCNSLGGSLKAAKIACGEAASYVIDTKGDLYSWGDNREGQLGRGTVGGSKCRPKLCHALDEKTKELKKFVSVAGGVKHALACTTDGMVYSWGRWDTHAHGLYKHVESSRGKQRREPQDDEAITVPQEIQDVEGDDTFGIVDVAAGHYHSIIIDESDDGPRDFPTAWTFGQSSEFQTGQGEVPGGVLREPKGLREDSIRDFNVKRAAAGGDFTILGCRPKTKV